MSSFFYFYFLKSSLCTWIFPIKIWRETKQSAKNTHQTKATIHLSSLTSNSHLNQRTLILYLAVMISKHRQHNTVALTVPILTVQTIERFLREMSSIAWRNSVEKATCQAEILVYTERRWDLEFYPHRNFSLFQLITRIRMIVMLLWSLWKLETRARVLLHIACSPASSLFKIGTELGRLCS